VSENDTTVAYAEVDSDDRGVAIGKDGQRIELARQLAKRHFDIDDIELT
jgi:N utilization substance protein A